MSLALETFALRYLPRPSPKVGRPRVADNPVQRRRHIKAAHYRLVQGKSRDWVARKFHVDVKTIYNWVNLALGYDCAEGLLLRRAVDAAKARRRAAEANSAGIGWFADGTDGYC